MRNSRQLIWGLIILHLILLAGCSGQGPPEATPTPDLPVPTSTDLPTPTAEPAPTEPSATEDNIPVLENTPMDPSLPYQEVTFWSEGDVNIAGYIYQPEGEITQQAAVFLIHSCESDHMAWEPFAQQLTEMGYLVFSMELRGYGASGGRITDVRKTPYDVRNSMDYLKGYGYEEFICIGASIGGAGCLAAAKSHNVVGLGLISGLRDGDRRIEKITRSDLENLNIPKVVAVAEEDRSIQQNPDFVNDILTYYEQMPEPKVLKLYPGIEHGVELLDGETGPDLIAALLDMIKSASE